MLHKLIIPLTFLFTFSSATVWSQSTISLKPSRDVVTNPTAPVSTTSAPGEAKTDLLFLLDVSGSMNSILESNLMIDWAKQAIDGAVSQLPPEAEVGLRVYAHRVEKSDKEASCKDTELLVPIGARNGPLVALAARGLKPKGWTPIAYSLEQSAGDFGTWTERLHTIILVSDGEETCGGDPLAAARGLVEKGFKIKIFTIGFNVQETARKQLEELAREFGGTYADVRSGANLEKELRNFTQQTFLIKKEKQENRIRGGDSIPSAVPIEPNVFYQLDHHQRKGEYDYFSLSLKPKQNVSILVQPTSKCLQIEGSQAIEKEATWCTEEAFRFVLNDLTGRNVAKIDSSLVDKSDESEKKIVEGTETALHYLVVGSPFGDMHRDHSFKVIVEGSGEEIISKTTPAGDGGTDQDAGDSRQTALSLTAGVYENNSLSREDKIDMFQVAIPENFLLKVVASSSDIWMKFSVLGELNERLMEDTHVQKGSSVTFESQPAVAGKVVYLYLAHEGSKGTYSMGIDFIPFTITEEKLEQEPVKELEKESEDEAEEEATREVSATGDGGTNQDAGNSQETALALNEGVYDNNTISKTDSVDMFELSIPKRSLAKVVVSTNDEIVKVDVTGKLGEKLVNKNVTSDKSVTFESEPEMAGETIYLRIAYRFDDTSYSIGVDFIPIKRSLTEWLKLVGGALALLFILIVVGVIWKKIRRRG